ncbi:MAG: transporter substrate-binding domain-containing protein [bacterium]
MTKNTIISSVVLAALALVVISAGFFGRKTGGSETQDALTKILNTKRMDVCVAEWPPASIKDARTGEYSGHDIDAYKMIAKEIGASVVFHDTTFGNMPAAIQSGVCDSGTSLYVKPSRAAAVDFTRPVLFGGDSGLVRKGDKRFKTVEDINQAGVKVAVATGESGHIFAKTYLTKAKIISIDVEASDLTRFALEVSSGRADIAVADGSTLTRFAAAHPETEMVFVSEPLDLNPDAFPVRMGETKFLNFLNNSIFSLQVSGEWKNLEKKYDAHWFHEDVTYRVE